MLTGSLQIKKDIYYAVLNIYDDFGNRKPKWISTKLKVKGNKRLAQKILTDIITDYTNKSKSSLNKNNIAYMYKDMLFSDYMLEWLESIKSNVARTTYIGYEQVVKNKIYIYFKEKR